jgi:hypothetical protein
MTAKTTDQKHRPVQEDAARLREVLDALVATCANEVFRLEALVCDDGYRLILTCSNQTKEEDVGAILVSELKRLGMGSASKTEESKP